MIGWVGPLFWPYAYYDVVDYAFYPYSYDTFWPYAYDDVYHGVFGAYAYGYDANGYDEDDVTVGRSSRLTGDTSVAQPPQPAGGVALCATQVTTLTDWAIERIAEAVEPDDKQRAALEKLKEATSRSLDILRSKCPTALPSTPTGRLAAMRQRLETMLLASEGRRPHVANTRCDMAGAGCLGKSVDFADRGGSRPVSTPGGFRVKPRAGS